MTIASLKADVIQLFDKELGTVAPVPAPTIITPPQSITPVVWPLQADMPTFYGDPGGYESSPQRTAWENANLVDVSCPWVLNMDGVVVKQIRIHRKCAESLTQILNAIWNTTGQSQSAIETLRYNRFSGSYAPRTIRGGTSPSCHNFGAAIDWDAADNEQHSMNHLFTDQSLLIVKFKEGGWICGLDWSPQSIDSMHVQASKVH
jgi:hypothetical protein